MPNPYRDYLGRYTDAKGNVTVFHGTSLSNAEEILAKGFEVRRGPHTGLSEKPAAFVTVDKNVAKRYGRGTEQAVVTRKRNDASSHYAVFELSMPRKAFERSFQVDPKEAGSFRSENPVDPKHIRSVRILSAKGGDPDAHSKYLKAKEDLRAWAVANGLPKAYQEVSGKMPPLLIGQPEKDKVYRRLHAELRKHPAEVQGDKKTLSGAHDPVKKTLKGSNLLGQFVQAKRRLGGV